MRFIQKKSYDADIGWFKDKRQLSFYVLFLVILFLLPLFLSGYAIGEVTTVLILSIAGMGLMLLIAHTGLPSLGHAFFMALGCYAHILLLDFGLPWLVSFVISGCLAGGLGTLIMLPVFRLHGVYMALATLALSILISDIIVLAAPVTGGVGGLIVPSINLFGLEIDRFGTPSLFYYVALCVTLFVTVFYANLLRTSLGRSFMAVRDSEIAARAMGVNLTVTKSKSLFLSAAAAGYAGALFGHSAGYVNSETFDFILSINLLLMIVIGGLGFIHGVFLGAVVIGIIPALISNFRSFLSSTFEVSLTVPGLESAIFAFILICFVLFEPLGLYGRWLKIRTWFDLFPFYRRSMFRRQKTYLKTERIQ